MGNLVNVNLVVNGAAVDVSAMGKTKTVIVGSVSGNINVEFATDLAGTSWAPLASFQDPGNKTFDVAAHWMRAVGGSGNVDVAGSAVGSVFAQIPTPPDGGIGATVDISEFPLFKTVVVGPFDGTVNIETSEDGVSWAQMMTFHAGGGKSLSFYGALARAKSTDGAPTIFIGGANEGDLTTITAPLGALVYRPGATGVDAPGGNVFTSWSALMAVIDQTRHLGLRTLEFDASFAPNPSTDPVLIPFLAFNTIAPAQSNLWPCAIPPPPAGESWDMLDVCWSDRTKAPGGSSLAIQIWDGGPDRPCLIDNLKRIDAMLPTLIYNGKTVGNHPFVASRSARLDIAANGQVGWNLFGVRARICNTDASAQPMWLADVIASFWDNRGDTVIGTIGTAMVNSPAPLIEIPTSGNNFILYGYDSQKWTNNIFKGVAGSHIILQLYSSGTFGLLSSAQQFYNPQYAGDFIFTWGDISQRFHPSAVQSAALKTGTGDGIATTATLGLVTLTDAAGLFAASDVGKLLTLPGSTTPANDGTYRIVAFISATQIQYTNYAAVTEVYAGTWVITPVADWGDVTQVDATAQPVTVTLPNTVVQAPTTGPHPMLGTAVTVLDAFGQAALAGHEIFVRAPLGSSLNGVVENGTGNSAIQLTASAYSSLRFWTEGRGKWYVIA